jgi:hypothetical protein
MPTAIIGSLASLALATCVLVIVRGANAKGLAETFFWIVDHW